MHTFHDNDNLVQPPPLRDLPPKTRRPLSYPSGPESLPLPGGEDEEDEDEELQLLDFLDLTSSSSKKKRKRKRRLSHEPSFTIEEDHSSSPCSSSDKLITPEKKKQSPRIRPFGQESTSDKKKKRKIIAAVAAATGNDDIDDEDGAQLPAEFEPFPAELYGRPLEEVDNFIYDTTFCVVSRRFRKHYIHRFTASKSFFIFSPFNPIRNACVFVITNQFFDYIVMTTILFNCILLAMTETIEEAEYIFLGIYSMEMVIKSIAKGFILDKYSYLRSPWNWLDFIVISSGYVTICVQSGANLSGLRTFRVLRALKTISILPGLKTIINALLHSFKQLAEVMTLTLFCLMVFALFALQVYKGELRNKCVLKMTDDSKISWLNWTSNPDNWLWEDSQESPILCGNVTGSRRCSPTHTCISIGENPNYGYTSFDNFFWSMLTTFQLITLDYWENVYNMVLATCGPMSISFFTVVVFFGSFYLINLMLAVVALSYEEEADIAYEEKKKELMDHRNDSTFSFNPTAAMGMKQLTRKKEIGSRIKGRKGMLLAYRRKNTRRRRRKRLEMGSRIEAEQQGDNVSDATMNNNPNNDMASECPGTAVTVVTNLPTAAIPPSPPPSSSSPFSDSLQPTSETTLSLPKNLIKCRQTRTDEKQSSLDDSGVVVVDEQDEDKQKDDKSDSDSKQKDDIVKETQLDVIPAIVKCNGIGMNRSNLIKTTQKDENGKKIKRQSTQCAEVIVISDEVADRNSSCCQKCCGNHSGWLRFQQELYKIVKDPIFELIITVCIVLNTIVLALEHHGMSQSILRALDIGNKVFTAIFTIECCFKIIALNEAYFSCGWNVFDLMIVSASLLDLIFELVDGLSVLRGLRLLRVLKLAQSWMTMRVLLSIIISTIGALGNLTLVLIIVIYIFAVIGMQLFAKDYTEEKFFPDPVPRWNFTDFFHSFMMIFRILCGEWIEPLWDCMRAERTEGPGICLAVFLPTLVMGNFMVLNLFLALLLNNFNSEELRNRKEVVGDESKMARTLQRIRELMMGAKRDGEITDKDLERKLSNFGDVAREVVLYQRQIKQEDEAEIYERAQHFPRDKISYLEAMNRPISIISYSEYQDDHSRRSSRYLDPNPRKYISITTNPPPLPQVTAGEDKTVIAGITSQCSTNESSTKNNKLAVEADPESKNENKPHNLDSTASRPWQTLVSYVDEITVGGRKSSSGREMEFSGAYAGEKKRSAEPPDCFPVQFYERLTYLKSFVISVLCIFLDYCRCHCLKIYCIQNNSKTVTHWAAFRRWILSIVDTSVFEWCVLALIFASSVTLCFEDVHLDENPDLKTLLYWTNLTFSVIFLMEMIFKWIAFGFYKYFSGFWTLLDFFIVTVSFFSLLIEENENLRALRSLRTLRALRPLRAISRWQGMRIVVNALMYAIPSIFNVLLVCLVFWLIFSIMGVQFFSGKFYKCLDADGERLDTDIVNNKWDCQRLNYTWRNSKISFDHVGVAYLALFQVATFEGWMEVMADAVDVRGVDLQPKRESNLYAYIYFIIFIVCGSFFTLNLFIGVIIDNFNMLKKKYEGGVLEIFLTENQKHYYTAMKKLSRKKPQKVIRRPTNAALATFYDLANSRRFEIAIFTLIFLNMISMAVEHHNQAEAVIFVLEVSNAFFTTVFGLECIVKIMGLRYHYFTVPWNVFDFLLVIASILGILMEDAPREFPVSPTLLRVVRVFRIGRILRLIKAAKGIRKLLFALIVSLPALFNIGALLALITFIYAIIGMFLFGHVRQQGALDDMVNFETFGRSTHLLFRLITSAGWNDVLESLMIQYPDCDPHFRNQSNGDCGYPLLSIVYLTSFIIINHMIVINMYIAVILENFNQAHQEEEIGIVEDDLEMFYIRWSRYDPHATQFIRFCQLSDFIASLDAPLGIPKPNTVALVSFDLPIAKGEKIHCLDVLHALVKHVLGHVEETEYFRQLQQQMNLKFKKQFPTRKRLEVVSSTRIWKRRETAAKVIQKAWKDYLNRKKEKEKQAMRTFSASSTSPPGDWKSRLSTLFLHVHRGGTGSGGGSRGSSRKSSRASDDVNGEARSMSGGPWLNLPLLLFSNVATATANVPYSLSSPVDMASDEDRLNHTVEGSPSTVPTRRRSLYDYFFLRHQDAIDKLESPGTPRKEFAFLRPDMTAADDQDEKEDESLILSKHRLGVRRSLLGKKRFGSFSVSPTSSQRTSGGTPVSILVTKASPENAGSNSNSSEPLSPPEGKSKPTVVQVLVHRESSEDEYNRAEEREALVSEQNHQTMEGNNGQVTDVISPLSSPTFSSSSISSSLREINKDTNR